jgi:hypothetical protein
MLLSTRLYTVIISILLLLALLECCFGQTDTNLLATGDWSDIVRDHDEHATYALRGRLLVYNDHVASAANHARVYLELQNVFEGGWSLPLEVYFGVEGVGDSPKSSLFFEMRDAKGNPIPIVPYKVGGFMPYPYDVVLPCDSTIRLRADLYTLGTKEKPDGFRIFVNGGNWIIRPNDSNEYFLSANLSVKDHPAPLKNHIWEGTLHLPPVKIPVKGHRIKK